MVLSTWILVQDGVIVDKSWSEQNVVTYLTSAEDVELGETSDQLAKSDGSMKCEEPFSRLRLHDSNSNCVSRATMKAGQNKKSLLFQFLKYSTSLRHYQVPQTGDFQVSHQTRAGLSSVAVQHNHLSLDFTHALHAQGIPRIHLGDESTISLV